MNKSKPVFSSEFKEDPAALRRWVSQLKTERQGITPKGKAITVDQKEIQGFLDQEV